MEYKNPADVLHEIADRWETGPMSRIFGHTARVRWYTPPVLFGISWELDEPNRKGYTVILRYSWRHVLALGFWGKKGHSEEEALLSATVMGRKRRQDERDAFDDSILRDHSEDENIAVFQGGPGLRNRATTDARADVDAS